LWRLIGVVSPVVALDFNGARLDSQAPSLRNCGLPSGDEMVLFLVAV
jgi:hypothetical protein